MAWELPQFKQIHLQHEKNKQVWLPGTEFKHQRFQSYRETNTVKNGCKVVFMSPRLVYTEYVRNLQSSFNEKHTPVLLSLFFWYKPYYCIRPTEKEKLSCLCINCLNPHLLLQSINIYWKSKVLLSHNSLTEYINCLQNGKNFVEANDEKPSKFYSYMRVTESYISKENQLNIPELLG